MASKIKVDQIVGSTGSTVTIPTGQTLTIVDGVPVASGGTGLSSFTAGDVLYATGSTTLAKLPKGTAEQVLAMNAGATAPDWGSIDLTVLPTITVAKGGTNLSSFTAGDFLYATGATTLAKLAKGSALQVIQMNAGATAPEWVAPAGGATAVVASGTISGSPSEIVHDGIFTSAYKFYELFISDLHADANAQWFLQMRNSSATTSGSLYRGISNHVYFGSASYSQNQQGHWNTSTGWEIGGTGSIYSHVVSAMHGKVLFPWGDNISTYNSIQWKTWGQETSTTNNYNVCDGGGIYAGYSQYTGFRLYPASGAIAEGEYTVIGYKQ